MEEQIISKEEFKELIQIEGQVRGDGMKNKAKYILEKKGRQGLKDLEKAISDAGYPMNYQSLEKMELYPVGLEAATLIAIKRIFDFQDDDFRELGKIESKFTLIIRLFMKYFISLDRATSEAPRMWRKYYTVGDLEIPELNKEEQYLKLRLKDFSPTPLLCRTHEGYFSGIFKLVVRKPVSCREVKCVHRGDDYHEFLIEW